MIEYLKELLYNLEMCKNDLCPIVPINNIKQKIFAPENSIEILEKLRNEERSEQHGNIE